MGSWEGNLFERGRRRRARRDGRCRPKRRGSGRRRGRSCTVRPAAAPIDRYVGGGEHTKGRGVLPPQHKQVQAWVAPRPPRSGGRGRVPPPQAAAAAVCRRVEGAVTRRGARQCVPPCVPRHARADSGYSPSGRGASNWAEAPPTARARRVLRRRPPAGLSARMTWRPRRRGETARRHKSCQFSSVLKRCTKAERPNSKGNQQGVAKRYCSGGPT